LGIVREASHFGTPDKPAQEVSGQRRCRESLQPAKAAADAKAKLQEKSQRA